MINNSKHPLIYFNFLIGGSEVGRVFIEPSSTVPSDIANAFLSACHPVVELNSCSSLYGATISEARPHSMLRLSACKRQKKFSSSAAQEQNSLAECAGYLPLNPCLLLPTDENRNDGAPQEPDPSGKVYFSSHQSPDNSSHPELCFTANSCSCLDSGRWGLVGRVYKGMEILHHVAALHAARKELCILNECGAVHPGAELGLVEKDALIDYWPDLPKDAPLRNSDWNHIVNVVKAIKTSGSILFRQEKYDMAKFKFSKAIKYVNYALENLDLIRDQQNRLIECILPCILNSAASKLKLKDYDGALEDCNEAIELGPHDPKVYFRRGQAHHGKMNYDQSLYDLYRALKLSPNDKSIKSEIAAVEGELQVYRKDILCKMSST